ncbi:hypothetical protein MJG53_016098 [Ovis ammon polii x Ovis aries]|uniref:Uncharacterized protein n=1 Tax=Ovis ammon polii x Ovis aries TaxID=2918886 RepID=A0ACB9UBE7_9CETA|nr:hypothetical protein MJG53_016098 [Ovis ammon polii x Ovis aries]
MAYCRQEGKDRIIFVTKEDHETPSNAELVADDPNDPYEEHGLILPNGDINWNCPCLGGMASGPCGEQFKAAFSCFHYSKEDVKGSDCVGQFRAMQECMQRGKLEVLLHLLFGLFRSQLCWFSTVTIIKTCGLIRMHLFSGPRIHGLDAQVCLRAYLDVIGLLSPSPPLRNPPTVDNVSLLGWAPAAPLQLSVMLYRTGEPGKEQWRKSLKGQGSKITTVQVSVMGTDLKTYELQENEKEKPQVFTTCLFSSTKMKKNRLSSFIDIRNAIFSEVAIGILANAILLLFHAHNFLLEHRPKSTDLTIGNLALIHIVMLLTVAFMATDTFRSQKIWDDIQCLTSKINPPAPELSLTITLSYHLHLPL